METKSSISFFVLLAAIALPVQALDFTPRYKEIIGEGGSVSRRIYFADGPKSYILYAGPNANMTSESNTLRFTFDELEGASLLFRLSSFTPALSFEDGNLEKYRQSLASFLPPGVTEVTVEEEIPNPFPINDWKSYGYVIACKLPGSTLRVCVTFLNLDEKQQIVLVTTAYGNVFKEAQERSNAIIRSWHPITEATLAMPEAS